MAFARSETWVQMSDWERTIFFEGVALPRTAIAIDHLAFYDNLPEMSEATAEWLWRFTICVGVSRSDTSENILLHVTESRDLLYMFRDRLLKSVPKHYDNTFKPSVLDSWLFALQTMVDVAQSHTHCSWVALTRIFHRSVEI